MGNMTRSLYPITCGEYDTVFISETNLGYDALPRFGNYVLIADPKERSCIHGDVAWLCKERSCIHGNVAW